MQEQKLLTLRDALMLSSLAVWVSSSIGAIRALPAEPATHVTTGGIAGFVVFLVAAWNLRKGGN